MTNCHCHGKHKTILDLIHETRLPKCWWNISAQQSNKIYHLTLIYCLAHITGAKFLPLLWVTKHESHPRKATPHQQHPYSLCRIEGLAVALIFSQTMYPASVCRAAINPKPVQTAHSSPVLVVGFPNPKQKWPNGMREPKSALLGSGQFMMTVSVRRTVRHLQILRNWKGKHTNGSQLIDYQMKCLLIRRAIHHIRCYLKGVMGGSVEPTLRWGFWRG